MDKISIIVPVYNSEKYIGKCIESLINQTYSSIEIIIVDDGSTDNSSEICRNYAKCDERIKFIQQKNQGVSVARNIGIDQSIGQWITFVDSDDWIDADMCQSSLIYAKKYAADTVLWSYYTEFENKTIESKLIYLPEGDITKYKDILQLKTISQDYGDTSYNGRISAGTTWGKLYKRNIIMDNNIRFKKGLTRAQDTVFSLYAFEHSAKIVLLDKLLYHYRISDLSITSGLKYIADTNKPFEMLLNEYLLFINHYHKSTEFDDAIKYRVMRVLMWHIKYNYMNKLNPNSYFSRLSGLKKLIGSEPYYTSLRSVNYKNLPKSIRLMGILLKNGYVNIYFRIYTIIIAYSKLMKK